MRDRGSKYWILFLGVLSALQLFSLGPPTSLDSPFVAGFLLFCNGYWIAKELSAPERKVGT